MTVLTNALLTASLAALASADKERWRVMSMPDMADFDTYAMYSGYVAIPDSGSAMHYIFVEA